MKVYGDGGGMFAQVFGKSEQPIYDPQNPKQKPRKQKVKKGFKNTPQAIYERKNKDRIAEELKDPNSKYHGMAVAAQLAKDKRCNCPKCQQAYEKYRNHKREYNRGYDRCRRASRAKW